MGRATLSFGVVVALGSGGCQVLLGIDTDVAISTDASTGGDSDTDDAAVSADASAPETAADVAEENLTVYKHGDFSWTNDDASGAIPDYVDEASAPLLLQQTEDLKVSLTREGGAWGAIAPDPFPGSLYATWSFYLKPTVANQTWTCYLLGPDGGTVLSANVDASTPSNNSWQSYKIYLDGGTIAELLIQDTTGLATNVWYVNDVGFEP